MPQIRPRSSTDREREAYASIRTSTKYLDHAFITGGAAIPPLGRVRRYSPESGSRESKSTCVDGAALRLQLQDKLCHDAKVPAAPSQAPEQIEALSFVGNAPSPICSNYGYLTQSRWCQSTCFRQACAQYLGKIIDGKTESSCQPPKTAAKDKAECIDDVRTRIAGDRDANIPSHTDLSLINAPLKQLKEIGPT
jgi:hypothetical protein